MERGFYNEDIEELLKEKADQYKMYPSDKVWKGIHRSLHPTRKWYWFSLILFLSAVGYYTFIEFITPSTANKSISENNVSSTVSNSTETTDANTPKAVIVPFGNSNKQAGNTSGNTTKQRPFVLNPENSNDNTGVVINIDQPVTSAITDNTNPAETNTTAITNEAPVYNMKAWQNRKDWQIEPANNPLLLADNPVEHAEQVTHQVPASQSLIDPTSVNESKLAANTNDAAEDSKRLNWLANNAVYEIAVPKQNRLSWQISFTPTMNYRTLKGSNDPSNVKTNTPVPQAPDIPGNLDQLVNHKPALGFELGSNILYAVNKTVTLKTGLLFNYARYDIQAYSSDVFEPAVIALDLGYGIGGGQVTSYTRYRNFGGKRENLNNQYFQLSVPLGLEINLLGNEKLHVGVGGTVQPTYLLNRNIYLITTDFKYATEPSLVRKWNINTSAEAFISYKTGDLKWQVGPQLRYQLLSSYIKEYPIRENLFQYGIKIGVTKTIR
ncbi:MAG TPA: hypothetical protein VF008_32720 [Niastella sp.]